MPGFMAIPPLIRPWGLSIAAKACYRPPPTQKRAIESGEGVNFRSSARRYLDALTRRFGPCGVGNGNDFKRLTARSIHLRRRAVEAGPFRRRAVGSRYPLAHNAQHPAQYPD